MLSVSLPNVGCWSALLLWSSRQAPNQAGCNPSAWRPVSCCFSACPLGVSAGLCCFALTHWADHRSPVCQVLLCSLILAVYWVLTFFSSPQNPKHFHFFTVTVHQFFPLLLSSVSSLSSLPPVFLWHHLCHVNSTPQPGLCCAVAVHRSEQDRWSQMISGLCSFLQETAWYCYWHDALSWCLQVQGFHSSVPSVTSVNFRWRKWLGTCTHPSVWSLLFFNILVAFVLNMYVLVILWENVTSH